jgi:RNA polymerase-binding transcription factor DksA
VLTSRDRRFLRTHVLEEVIRLEELVQLLGNESSTGEPPAEVRAMLSDARSDLVAMRSMLDRIEQPGYGVCEHCHGFIGVERLIALPDIPRCFTCTGVIER